MGFEPVLQGWPFTLTATSNDAGADLTNQYIQFCLPGSSTWESGTQWTGSATANHTLTWNYSPAVAGTLQFRAWGVDAAGRVGNTPDGSVVVRAITAESDFDGDGMPDTWEVQNCLNPTNPADASMDIDGDGLSNLEEYILWRNPREDNFDNRAMEVPVTITILAKGSGTVSLTVVDSKGKSVGGANGLFTSTNTADWSKSSGSPYGPSLAIGENYHLTTSATGVADYVIKVTPTLRNTSLLDAAVELNGSRADTILKTEMIAGSCTLRMVPRRLVPFAQIDCSQLEESRIFNFGFGDSRSGQSPGLITCSGGSIIASGSRFELKVIKGPALEWSYETPTHFQGRAPAGYIEVLRTRARSTVRYYPRDDRPDSAAFKDFSAVPPIATYYIDHRINGMTITQSIAGVEMMYQDETETNESSLFYNTVESVPEGQVYVPPTEKYTTITGTKRHWRWQTPPRPNETLQGLTKTVATTHRVELLDVATPMSSWYEPIYMTVTRYNGATESAPVELFASREYAPEDFLLKQMVAEGYGVAGETAPGSGTRSIGMGGSYLIPSTLILNSNGNRSLTNYYSEVRFGFYDTLGTSNLEGQPAIALGERKQVWRPFGDSSLLASVSSETPVTTNPVTTYSYYADPVDGEAVVSGTVSRKDTTVIGRTDYTYVTGTFSGWPTITTAEAVYSSATAALITITQSYSCRLADPDICGKPISIQRPDGTKTSYVYQRGTLSSSGGWSASESGAHLLIAELTGKTGASITSYNPTTNTTAAGAPVDPLDLEPGRSLVSQTILNADGLVLREASYVYTAANTFSLLAATYHRYDVWGNLIKKTDQPEGAGRVLFEASYSGFRKSWECDASGVKLLYAYDNLGRVASVTREEASFETKSVPSVVTTYAYDDTSALVNGRGQVVRKTVSSPGETKTLVSETATDTAGRVVKTTAPGGYVTTTAYACSIDVSSLNSTTTAPDGGTTIVNYFFDGRKRSVTGTAVPDTSYTYTYAADGNLTTTETVTGTTPAVSQWSSTVTDWSGRVVANTTPARNGAASATRVVTHRYNALGQLTAQDVTSGGVKIMPTRLFAYDPYGRLLREATDTNNNNAIDLGADADVKEYEDNFQQTSFARLDTGAATGTAWYRYEGVKIYPYEGTNAATGRYYSQTYAQLSGLSDGWAAHSFGYDFDRNATESFATLDRAAKLQVATTLTTGTNQAIVQRSLNGLVIAATDAQGLTTSMAYDGLGRLIGVTAPRTGLTATAYVDLAGGNQTTTLVASITAPDGKITAFGYDTAGRQNRVTAPDGKIDYCQYDASGHLLYTWGATVNPVRYVYDELGRRTGMYTYRTGDWSGAALPAGFAAGGDQTTWAYDGATGLLLSKTDAANRSTAYAYDAAGRMLTRTDARGVVTSYGYFDASYATTARFNGLQRTVTYTLGSSGAAATTNLAYTYHRTGKIKTVTDAAGTRTFNYCETWTGDSDLSGPRARLREEVLPAGYFGSRTLTYGYQYAVAGRRNGAAASVQYGAVSDYGVTYGYDDRLRLARVGTSATALPFDYGYTADSNLIARVAQWASGTSTDYSRAHTYQGSANRLANLQHTWGANIPGRVEAQLGYDSVGLRSSEATAGSSLMSALGRSAGLYTAFAYTPRRELDTTGQFDLTGSWGQGAAVAGTARDYNYDPIGNRTADQSGSYAVNALNQYTTAPGAAALTYDLAGNLTSDGTRSYTFDAENRVASVVQGGATSTFKYDFLGRRIAKTVAGGETRYVYDGWNLIAELAPTTFAIQRTYTWGLDASGSLQGAGGVGGLLCIASGANRYYPIYDGSFNVIGLYDGTGAMAAAYRYDPCGNLLQSTGAAATINPFGFSTKFTDRETGLIYYGLRYYHAPLGRFINRDPIEEAGGINLYAFCGNDGVNKWDVLGRQESEEERKMREAAEEAARKAAEEAKRKAQQELIDRYGLAGYMAGAYDDEIEQAGQSAYYQASGKGKKTASTSKYEKSLEGAFDNITLLPGRRLLATTPTSRVPRLFAPNTAGNPPGSNTAFLTGWLTGSLPSRITYDPASKQTTDMKQSPGADVMRDRFYGNGAQTTRNISYGTGVAYWDTIVTNPKNWSSTALQVGGFGGASVVNNGDGTATFTIINVAGTKSFFYHIVPDLSSPSGPMHNVTQTFIWTEPINPPPPQPPPQTLGDLPPLGP